MTSPTGAFEGLSPTGAAFCILYEPSIDGFLRTHAMNVIRELVIPKAQSETIGALAVSEAARHKAEQLCRELLEEFPPVVKAGFEQACRQPYDM
jgi:hypothetical protein